MKKIYQFILPVVVAATAAPAVAATATVYTDRTAFEAALGGTSTNESFDDATLDPFFSLSTDNGFISGGTFNDNPGMLGGTTTWSFGSDVRGWGGDWNLAGPGGLGFGLSVTYELAGGGFESAGEIPRAMAGGFWGIVVDEDISSVIVSRGFQDVLAIGETHTFDNMVARTDIPPVPLPASFPLFAGALGGWAFLRRRRNKS